MNPSLSPVSDMSTWDDVVAELTVLQLRTFRLEALGALQTGDALAQVSDNGADALGGVG